MIHLCTFPISLSLSLSPGIILIGGRGGGGGGEGGGAGGATINSSANDSFATLSSFNYINNKHQPDAHRITFRLNRINIHYSEEKEEEEEEEEKEVEEAEI